MNTVTLTGRLTKDPEIRYAGATQMAVCSFNLAVDRQVKKGEEKQADFPKVICFGKTAENLERFCHKGSMIGVQGRIQTGSYEKNDGSKVYTTDVIADRIEFLSFDKSDEPTSRRQSEPAPEGFAMVNEDIPF